MTTPSPTPNRTPNPAWTPRAQALSVPQRPRLSARVLADVEPEDVQWLWYPYIPAGKLTLLEGDPGQGKSWITCSLAADLSQGRKLPGQGQALPPQRVLMLSAEDGLGDTIRPRIEALGGNMDNIFASDDFFILDPTGIKEMEDLMRAVAATIVFMDPIVAYMGAKVDMWRANEVRGIMTALSEAAKRTGSAIVAVRHLRKSSGKDGQGKAIYAGIGSIDFTAAVRSVMQVQETKSGTKYVYHAKHNLTPKGASLAYSFADGAFHWEGTLRTEDTGEEPKVATKSKRVAQAEALLREWLANGPVPALQVYERAAEAGISSQVLNRAKKDLGIVSHKIGNEWVWANAGEEPQVQVVCVEPSTEPEPAELDALVAEAKAKLALSQQKGYNSHAAGKDK